VLILSWLLSQGAISGMIGGLLVTLWISVGGAMYATPTQTLPVGNCQGNGSIVLPPPDVNA